MLFIISINDYEVSIKYKYNIANHKMQEEKIKAQ